MGTVNTASLNLTAEKIGPMVFVCLNGFLS